MNVHDIAGKLVRRGRAVGRALKEPAVPPSPPVKPAPVISGLVEDFTRYFVVGWISVPADTPPVKVSLHLGGLKVAATYATPGAMSGIYVGGDGSVAAPQARVRRSAGDSKPQGGDAWRARSIKGPRGDRRNSRNEIRVFSFRIHGIWEYARRSTRITVRVKGQRLPIHGHGMFLRPRNDGEHRPADLRRKFAEGHVLSQMGQVQLSKKLDVEWQDAAMRLYSRVRQVLQDKHGYDPFLIYGTLLGAVREGGYIGHDADFDAAYVSRCTNGPDAAQELEEIAFSMLEAGLGVDLRARLLHVHDSEDPDFHIDLFHTWFEEGRHRFAFGVAGTTTLTAQDWQGTHEIDFPGGRAVVPVAAEKMVRHLYGDDWHKPKPGFNWHMDRTDQAAEGELSLDQRTKIYWANFYARNSYARGSSFFEFINARPETPGVVLDIGCGDGRDSRAFGVAGRTVLGLDQSPVGIEHARARAAEVGVDDRVSFDVCDVADVVHLGRALASGLEAGRGPVLYYLRFFLHAITEETQERLLESISTHARPGDLFAAEFRSDKDQANPKVHGKHYRRFQSAEEFREALTGRFDFAEVLFDVEGIGLSPYGEEDPVLYRILARRG